jgi:lauroyl/myristoyl acyltransferase
VHIEIPYKPAALYLRAKYGRQKADAAIEWWNDLPEKIQQFVSPRRLEYALQIHEMQGNLAFVLPHDSNYNKLIYALDNGSPRIYFNNLISNNDPEKLKDWLRNENNYNAVNSTNSK